MRVKTNCMKTKQNIGIARHFFFQTNSGFLQHYNKMELFLNDYLFDLMIQISTACKTIKTINNANCCTDKQKQTKVTQC